MSAEIFISIWYVRNFLRSKTTDIRKTRVLGRTRGKESLTKCIAFQENALRKYTGKLTRNWFYSQCTPTVFLSLN